LDAEQRNAERQNAEQHGPERIVAKKNDAGRFDTGDPSKDSPNTEQRIATRTGEGNE